MRVIEIVGPRQDAKPSHRYYVRKESGSQWARVMDGTTGQVVKRFNVLTGLGKRNGWQQATALCARLNSAPVTGTPGE